MYKRNILLLLVLLFTIWLFTPSLFLGFISDDFFYVNIKSFKDAINFTPGFYHYIPVFRLTLFGIKQLFGLNPFIYHFIGLSIHLANIVLVYFTAQRIIHTTKTPLIAGFLFAVYFSHYEVVFWVTGISTSLMVFFYLLGFLSFLQYFKSGYIRYLIAFHLLFFISFLTHEYAISLPAVTFLYFYINKKISSIVNAFFFLTPPLAIIILISVLKLVFFKSPFIVSLLSISRIASSIIKSIDYLFTVNPYFIDRLPHGGLVILFILLCMFIYLFIRKNKMNFFLFLWCLATIFVFSFTSNPQARYFYLSSIPVSLLLSSIFQSAHRNHTQIAVFGIFFIYITTCIIFSNQQLSAWKKSSQIIAYTLKDFDNLLQNSDIEKNVVFIDFPDSSTTGVWKAYIWRNGLEHFMNMQFGIPIANITFYRSANADDLTRYDLQIDSSVLANQISRSSIVLKYDKSNKTVRRIISVLDDSITE